MSEASGARGAREAKRFFEAFDRRVAAQPADVRSAMEGAGFEVAHTGGGCLAYERAFGDGYVWITAEDGVSLPQALDEASLVGAYGADGEYLNVDERLPAPALAAISGTLMAEAGRRFAAGPVQEFVALDGWISDARRHGLVVPAEEAAVEAALAALAAPPGPAV